MTTLAVVVATGLFVIQVIASVLRRDGSGLARALKGLLVAFVGSVAAIAVTTLLLAAVDALSAGFVQCRHGRFHVTRWERRSSRPPPSPPSRIPPSPCSWPSSCWRR